MVLFSGMYSNGPGATSLTLMLMVAVDEPPADESDERLKRAGAADDLLLVLTHVVLSMLQVVTNAVALPVRKAKVVATSSTSR